MALPKINTPVFTIKIPSTGKELKFRPFLVKEEKILLIAQKGDSIDEISALVQIINNCCLDDIDIDNLTTFDVEYIFLKLRSRSVNNIVNLKYRDNEDDKIYEFDVNLDEIEMQYDPSNDTKIVINDEIGMIMKFPNVKIAQNISGVEDENDLINNILIHTIDVIYDKENVYPIKDASEQELVEFLENLDTKTFKKIEDFFLSMPKLYHELHYKNSLGNDRVIKLSSIQDFFT
jgi:hypothetical protein